MHSIRRFFIIASPKGAAASRQRGGEAVGLSILTKYARFRTRDVRFQMNIKCRAQLTATTGHSRAPRVCHEVRSATKSMSYMFFLSRAHAEAVVRVGFRFSRSARWGRPARGGPGPYLRAEEAPYPQALRRGWAASGPAGPGRPRGRETRRKSRRPARGRAPDSEAI